MAGRSQDVVYIRSRRTAIGKEGHPSLKCHPDGRIQCNTYGEAREWEGWRIHYLGPDNDGRQVIALQGWTGKYLTAHDCGRVGADWHSIGHRKIWYLVPSAVHFVAIQSCHLGKYLVCDDFFNCGNEVRADREHIQEWEEWAMSSIYGGNTGGAFAAAQSIGATQSWAQVALVGGAVAATGAALLENGNAQALCGEARRLEKTHDE
eukprot:Nitzschia sp. Nitz4//scaffold87_size112219//22459//23247//NITZ4_004066-RA/size112219-snap-gene-0.86-mRNA-1//1//CDS//3329559345//1114//frame0